MVLDNVTAEVSKKVKSAIKAKLTELGAYVDDELPDYIMILVGNKKTKDQMDDDLSLFLGHNTERFTSWLHNVLQKLNAASLLQNAKSGKEKDKKKDDEKEKSEAEVPKAAAAAVAAAATAAAAAAAAAPAAAPAAEEKKKHKKKKDKSEKKKEKKEKKKKKDKEKEKHGKSQKHKEKDRSQSKSKSPVGEEGPAATVSRIAVAAGSSEGSAPLKTQKRIVSESTSLDGAAAKSTTQESKTSHQVTESGIMTREDEDVPDDVVNLRPNAEDLALGLEDELPVKKQNRSVAKDAKEIPITIQPSQLQLQNIEVKVDISGSKEVATKPIVDVSEPEVTTSGSGTLTSSGSSSGSVHDRLGAPLSSVSPLSSSKRIINLREESSFPPKAPLHGSGEGIGRVVSSAIASAVKSVALTAPSKTIVDGKTGKKLEARVRPLFSSRRTEVEQEENVDELPLVPPSRVVSTVGAVLKRAHSSEEPDEREEPSTKRIGVVSKIEVTPRPRRPGAMQANTALILRAVADAHKSVNKPSRKAVDEKEEEKMKKELFTRSYHERQSQRLSATGEGKGVKKFAITVPNALLKDRVEMQIGGKSAMAEAHLEEIEMEEEYGPEEAMETSIGEAKLAQEKLVPQPKSSGTSRLIPMQVDDPTGSTRFIVTLDGLAGDASTASDLRSRLSGRPVRTPSVDEEEYIEEVEEWEEVEEMEGVTPQGGIGQERISSAGVGAFTPKWKSKIDATGLVTKKEERCRYWPACKEGTACQYIHPTKLCITFPNCRFGDKCIYIHPNCKFDSACTKPNCPYTHAAARSYLGPLKSKVSAPKSKIKCRYYPKCVDMACPFMHPKQICRYGKSCQTPSCFFVHPDVTTGALLKWTAPKQTLPGGERSLVGATAAAVSTVSTTTPTLTSLNKASKASLTAI